MYPGQVYYLYIKWLFGFSLRFAAFGAHNAAIALNRDCNYLVYMQI